MYFFYAVLTNLVVIISPIIFFYRILKGKEDPLRFQEKICVYSKKSVKNKIWIHAASIGELMSVIPIIKKLEKNKKIKSIIVTTATTSSAKIFTKLKFKKTFHVYFPLDNNFLTKRFIRYWQPELAIFVDSEIWPNMYKNLKIKQIPIIILNARIVKKTLNKWQIFPNFAKEVFSKITLALPSNSETLKYLKLLNVRNIKVAGNLKYYGEKNLEKIDNKVLKNKFKNFQIWCAASTHKSEEIFLGKLHKKLKKFNKKLITIIIPRHINRSPKIIADMNKLDLKTIAHSSNQKLKIDTDIYLIDSYGISSKFYSLTNVAFVGGSLIAHGGQNPLEPARFGNFIINGPHINNFKEIYSFLKKHKMSSTTSSILKMEQAIIKKLNHKNNKQNIEKITKIGKQILDKNLFYINKYLT
ncbi:glycosyltransferase N-terminal domain-containing protein [Candidatus Pelagibacter sp.]|nr:glycosyltransferase N-terminal domain-containing protein [Candidatus Pelagibacter sp.]